MKNKALQIMYNIADNADNILEVTLLAKVRMIIRDIQCAL
jgi:hypothetical protein